MYISNTFPGNLRWRLLLDYILHGVTISVVLKNLYTVVSVVLAEEASNIGSNVQRERQISNIKKVTHQSLSLPIFARATTSLENRNDCVFMISHWVFSEHSPKHVGRFSSVTWDWLASFEFLGSTSIWDLLLKYELLDWIQVIFQYTLLKAMFHHTTLMIEVNCFHSKWTKVKTLGPLGKTDQYYQYERQ